MASRDQPNGHEWLRWKPLPAGNSILPQERLCKDSAGHEANFGKLSALILGRSGPKLYAEAATAMALHDCPSSMAAESF